MYISSIQMHRLYFGYLNKSSNSSAQDQATIQTIFFPRFVLIINTFNLFYIFFLNFQIFKFGCNWPNGSGEERL